MNLGLYIMEPLGLNGYASSHMYRLEKQEKLTVRKNSLGLTDRVIETLFDNQAPSITLISEGGLYNIIMRSDKPEAQKFQNWVTQDVLPAIRKDGMYVQGEERVCTMLRAFSKKKPSEQQKSLSPEI